MTHHVLHVLGTARAEGASIARIVGTLGTTLDARYRVHACFLDGSGPLRDELAEAGVSPFTVDWAGGVRDPTGALSFWQNIRNREFAIVHLHFGARSVRWLARRASGASLVVHVHGCVRRSDVEL